MSCSGDKKTIVGDIGQACPPFPAQKVTEVNVDCDAKEITLIQEDRDGNPTEVPFTGAECLFGINTTNVDLDLNDTTNILTLTDSEGNSVSADVSALVSPPDVDFASTLVSIVGTQVTVEYLDANGGTITTSTFALPNVIENGDGTFTYNGITWATDDDVTAVSIGVNGAGDALEVTVTEGGTVVSDSVSKDDLRLLIDTDTNTVNTNFDYDDTTGDLTITDSDGNDVVTNIGVPPTPDVDFATTTDTFDANGDLVRNYFDADGNLITSSDPVEIDTIGPAKAPVVNADGSTTVCHDLLNADGTVDTVDYVCSTTSAPVTHIGKDCAGADIDLETEELITKQNHIDQSLGFTVPFVPNLNNACLPAPATGCAIDMHLITFNAEGRPYQSVVGSATWTPVRISGRFAVGAIGIPLIGDVTPDQQGVTFTSSEGVVTITNNSCDFQHYIMLFSYSQATYAISAGNQWIVKRQFDVGNGVYTGTNTTISNISGEIMNPSAGDYMTIDASTHFALIGLAPNTSKDIKARIQVEAVDYLANPDNKLLLNAGTGVSIRGFGHTTNP